MTATEETTYTGPTWGPDEEPKAGMTIHERMIAVLAGLPAIGKDQRNQQQNFMYRGHDDVMNALNPLLAKWGVFVVPDVLERITAERTTARGSTMYEVNLHVLFTFYGAGGDSVTATTWGEGTDSGDKSTNKAMTMAFKNVLAQAFALATEELSDADGHSPEETTRGGGERPQGRAPRGAAGTFDPGRSLLAGAIEVKSLDDANAIRMAFATFDPERDWLAVEDAAATHVYGHGITELTRQETASYWRRLANTIVKAQDLSGGSGGFPPPNDTQIAEAFAWAFNGFQVAPGATESATEPQDSPEPPEEAADAQEGAQRDGGGS
jgi:hypothetical protein